MALNIRKARRTIRLNDDPDSPAYVLALTDSSMQEKGSMIATCVADFERYRTLFEDPEANLPELQKKLAVTYGALISAFLGRDAYREIVEYVTDGDPEVGEAEVNVLLTPLVVYLVAEYAETMEYDERIMGRYLGAAYAI